MRDAWRSDPDLPRGWRRIRLDHLTAPGRRIVYGIVQAGPHVPGGVPYIRTSDIGGRIRLDSLLRTTPDIAARHSHSRVRAGDIVYSLRGNIGEMSIVPPALAGTNLSRGSALISVTKGVSPRFVRIALQSSHVARHIDRVTTGSTFREISIDQLRKVEIPLPPLREQRAIADLICCWDRAETCLRGLLHAKRRLKRGLMQQLLTGKRRPLEFIQRQEVRRTALGQLPEDWGLERLGGRFAQVRRKNAAGVTRVLTASGRHGLVDQREYFSRSVAGKSLDGYYLLRRGEFAYNRSMMRGYPFGAIKRLEKYDQGVVSTLYLCFTLTSEECDPGFYAQLFESGLLDRQLRGIAQVGARAHGLLNVSAADFFDLEIPVPSLREQQWIARVLSLADREIAVVEKQLHFLKEQKRGLMQKLLTGQVRVPPREEIDRA